MDSELRRRFLQFLSQDFAALDLNEQGVPNWHGWKHWPVKGPRLWPDHRSWWLASSPSSSQSKGNDG